MNTNIKQRRYWECECCGHVMCTLRQDDAAARNYACPQCKVSKCAHGGGYKEISKQKFMDEAGISAGD